jgi:hypothetical protein
LPGFRQRSLRPHPEQDHQSQVHYETHPAETRQLLASNSDPAALRRALARDLNLLLDRELQIKSQIAKKKAEIAELNEYLSRRNSESKSKRLETLTTEVAALEKVPPLYDPERFITFAAVGIPSGFSSRKIRKATPGCA